MKKYLLLPLIFIYVACSKEQKALNELEGKWKFKEFSINGDSILYTEAWMEFEKCKLKKNLVLKNDDPCEGRLYIKYSPSQEFISDFTYQADENIDVINLDFTEDFLLDEMLVYERTESSMTLYYTSTSDGFTFGDQYFYYYGNSERTIKIILEKE